MYLLASVTPSVAQALKSPFDGLSPPRVPTSCPAAPPIVVDVTGVDFYSDFRGSVPDPNKAAADVEAGRKIYALQAVVNPRADAYLASQSQDHDAAFCALELLDNWAQAGALTGKSNFQGSSHRMWALNSLAMSFLVIRNAPRLDGKKLSRVSGWLNRLAWLTKEAQQHTRNNHLYWAAAAAAAAAVASDDKQLFRWAMDVARQGALDVRPDGTLPLELARGKRAMRYHVFALEALVLLAEQGAANGIDLYAINDRALQRLSDLVTRNFVQPSELTALTGLNQEWPSEVTGEALVWAEPLYARFGDPQLGKLLLSHRPAIQGYWGGNATLQFGSAK
ncbi:alginate lyase family protein [Xanthobacter flavus]|uniref:alginate lyase family protein n=1 Tax=Xanthobacter flavus TaxID=281 RepID=UPI00372B70BD